MLGIGSKRLTVDDFESLLFKDAHISLDTAAQKEVRENYEFLVRYAKDKIIYGINTGLGPMAQYRINEEDQLQLQYNLIRSHSAGAGNLFGKLQARATMLARLNSLMRATSGIHPEVVQLLTTLINHQEVWPCIFERGGVGASGDLVQLAHLALNLIGEGEMFFNGVRQPSRGVFDALGIAPLSMHMREGLALMNGTSAMTGVGMVNIIQARYLIRCAVVLSSIINELMGSYDDHFSQALNTAKCHKGQLVVATQMRTLLQDSKLIRHRPDHLYHGNVTESIFTDKVQEYYSLRCVPQVLGPVYDTIAEVTRVLEDEVNSANDNPVVDHVGGNVYHGGNFHGDYVSLAMDKLKIAMVKLSMLSERQLNYILNDKLNQRLPSFVNVGRLGLNFGLQGMQFMATSTVAENQTLANPMYVHSISCNNDNQDLVSMGCNAAFLTKKVIENSFDVLAVQLLALMQAIDFLDKPAGLSSFTRRVYEEVRAFTPTITEDKPRYEEVKQASQYLTALGSKVGF